MRRSSLASTSKTTKTKRSVSTPTKNKGQLNHIIELRPCLLPSETLTALSPPHILFSRMDRMQRRSMFKELKYMPKALREKVEGRLDEKSLYQFNLLKHYMQFNELFLHQFMIPTSIIELYWKMMLDEKTKTSKNSNGSVKKN
ncbi:hypothetical protein SNEBB_009038 [Seison nebaliae]|nr:hypothetical protein SNEBB_009038 [Seison nebaliae]